MREYSVNVVSKVYFLSVWFSTIFLAVGTHYNISFFGRSENVIKSILTRNYSGVNKSSKIRMNCDII